MKVKVDDVGSENVENGVITLGIAAQGRQMNPYPWFPLAVIPCVVEGIHLQLWSSSVRTMWPFWVIPIGFYVRGLPDVD